MKRTMGSVALALACLGGAASIGTASASPYGDQEVAETAETAEPAAAAGKPRLTNAQREVIREATRRFRDPEVALAAGYVATDHCFAEPGVGGMGYHYAHIQRATDNEIDPTTPEVLLYMRTPKGKLKLAGVEYLRFDADQDLATDGDRPTLMGHPFDGPMAGHEPGMPVHYDLHVWLYEHNPAGELAPFNPRVTCPS